jgi:hypothetical protein
MEITTSLPLVSALHAVMAGSGAMQPVPPTGTKRTSPELRVVHSGLSQASLIRIGPFNVAAIGCSVWLPVSVLVFCAYTTSSKTLPTGT